MKPSSDDMDMLARRRNSFGDLARLRVCGRIYAFYMRSHSSTTQSEWGSAHILLAELK
jgi:hypothetical protein